MTNTEDANKISEQTNGVNHATDVNVTNGHADIIIANGQIDVNDTNRRVSTCVEIKVRKLPLAKSQ